MPQPGAMISPMIGPLPPILGSPPTGIPTFTPTPDLSAPQPNIPQPLQPASNLPTQVINVGLTVSDLLTALRTANPATCTNHTILNLSASIYILTVAEPPSDPAFASRGAIGLPIIRCPVTINGRSTTIRRDTGSGIPKFRIFAVNGTGELHLNGLIVRDGVATILGGGGILSVQGDVYLSNTVIENNSAQAADNFQTIGGGIYVFGGLLQADRSTFRNNNNSSNAGGTPIGDGGGVGTDSSDVIITRSNIRSNSTSRNGEGVFLSFSNATAVSGGCINANSAGGYGLYTTNGVNAYANWWGSSSGPNRTGTSNGTRDALYGTAVYVPYATNAIACGTTTATATPTVTRTPTPTFTPSPTPLPPCTSTTAPDVIGSQLTGTNTTPLRAQVSTYGNNIFFTVKSDGSIVDYPSRSWLWLPNTSPSVGQPGTVPTIGWGASEIIAYAGVIPWVDSTIKWVQVALPLTYSGGSTTLYVFIDGRTILTDCSYESLNLIPNGGLPHIAPATFAAPVIAGGPTPVYYSPFGRGANLTTTPVAFNQLPPAHMGSYGLHYGPTPPTPGTTLDVVPVNIELCIDTDSTQANCNPSQGGVRIPIYAPVSGCAVYDSASHTIIINIDQVASSGQPDCGQTRLNNDREVILTHLRDSIVGNQAFLEVRAGQPIANLCRSDELNTCGIAAGVPTHLAFQLNMRGANPVPFGGLGSSQQVYQEVLGTLARQFCLYDGWYLNLGATPATPVSPFYACP